MQIKAKDLEFVIFVNKGPKDDLALIRKRFTTLSPL